MQILDLNSAFLVGYVGAASRSSSYGVAHSNATQRVYGEHAFARSRSEPQGYTRGFWEALATQSFATLDRGEINDLIYQQLLELSAPLDGQRATQVIVPSNFSADALAVLLGILQKIPLTIAAMTSAPIAKTQPVADVHAVVHVDFTLFDTVVTRLVPKQGQLTIERSLQVKDLGVASMWERWLTVIASRFIQQSRLDPMRQAEHEQALFNSVVNWYADGCAGELALSIEDSGSEHSIVVVADDFIDAQKTLLQPLSAAIAGCCQAGEITSVQIDEFFLHLPALNDCLVTSAAAIALGINDEQWLSDMLIRSEHLEAGADNAAWIDQRLWPQPTAPAASLSQSKPSHVLVSGKLFRISEQPLTIGTDIGDDAHGVKLQGELAGVSRQHCRIYMDADRCIIEDSSSFGTFVNGQRIKETQVLKAGDRLRIGSPGFDMQLLAEIAS